MKDIIDEIIDEVHVELCRLMRCRSVKLEAYVDDARHVELAAPAVYHTIGQLAKTQHKGAHSVSWVEQGGKTDPSDSTKNEDGFIGNDTVRLRVLVFAPSKNNARMLYQNLRNVSLRVLGDQVSWGNSTAPSEERPNALTQFFAIEADCDIKIGIPQNLNQLDGFPNPIPDYELRQVESATVTVE